MNYHTLIADLRRTLREKGGWFTPELGQDFSANVARQMARQFRERTPRPQNSLWMSQLGDRCPRALWFAYHRPELAEPLQPWAEMKFAMGDIVEALTLTLVKASGHEVTGEQDEIRLDGVVGRRDCVIDGMVCDIKSGSSRMFEKFQSPSFEMVDTFGYLDQLDGYVVGSAGDPLVRIKDRGGILAIDRQMGKVLLYEHKVREPLIRRRIQRCKEVVISSVPPQCACGTEPFGKSGNVKLDTKASYNSFKHCCFPNLRTFLYSNGPVYLTRVVKVPDVLEIHR